MKSNDLEQIQIPKRLAKEVLYALERAAVSLDLQSELISTLAEHIEGSAPITGYTAVDMATAAAEGFRDGVASVVVELPELREDSDADDIAGVGLVIPMFDRGYDEAIEDCRDAIIAAGGKVKE